MSEQRKKEERFFEELRVLCEKFGVVQVMVPGNSSYSRSCFRVEFGGREGGEYDCAFDGMMRDDCRRLSFGTMRYRACRVGWTEVLTPLPTKSYQEYFPDYDQAEEERKAYEKVRAEQKAKEGA